MNSFEKISADLNEAFSKNPIFSFVLAIAPILMFVGAGLELFSATIGYGKILGTWLVRIIGALDFWIFVLGILATYAAGKFKLLTYGFAIYTAANIWNFIYLLIPRQYIGSTFSFSTLVNILIYGGITYYLFRKTFQNHTSI